jgi:hypothetical protein
MYIAELFENEEFKGYLSESQPQLVVLYPGRFQPFHLGHGEVFHSLQSKFGRDNVFIATSNKTESAKSPFNFTEKSILMHAAGIPADRIIEAPSPYKLPPQFDAANTVFVVAVGAPDRDRLRPDSTKKDGNESYFKTFQNLKECTTADKHGYVIVANERHKTINVGGKDIDVSHGTQARAAWNAVRKNAKQRSEYLLQMYGRDDAEIGRVLDKIEQTVTEDAPAENPADTYYFFDLSNTTHSFAPIDLKVLGLRQTKSGKWYYRPGHDSTPTLLQAKLNHLEQKLNARARPWKPTKVTETAGVGVIANKKQARDPRYSMSLTKDIRPGETERQLRKMHLADSINRLLEQVKSIQVRKS